MKTFLKLTLAMALAVPGVLPAADKTMIDYFLPMPIHGQLTTNTWGAPGVMPRDPRNGLEDPALAEWYYWDGKIIRGGDGKYHLFASRWEQSKGHNGWWSSKAIGAVSDNPTGPYEDRGLLWPGNEDGKGHNVTALVLPDGSYAVVVSETRPGDVFVSRSLEGPWEQIGSIKVKDQPKWHASNVCPIIRPDGAFEIIGRSGDILISTNGILGPYVIQGPSIYPKISGLPQYNLEDPVIWYGGGLYHITVNCWSDRQAFLLTSPNGITDWTNRGLAYDPTKDFLRYTDGTVNHWNKIERPGIYMENGNVVYFTFAVIDVAKEEDRGNMPHGSKVIVVPFDGAALDRDLQSGDSGGSPASSSAKGQ